MIARVLISPSTKTRVEKIEEILLQAGLSNPHPDLLYFPSDSKLGIAEARKIKEHFSIKPYSTAGRVVVLEDGSNLTIEAQNALLKTLEELPKEAIFLMGAASDANFLPTILSRCQIVILGRSKATTPLSRREPESGSWTSQDDKYIQDIEKLLNSTTQERFEYIEKLKDREDFLKSMVSYFHQTLNLHTRSVGSNMVAFLKELLQAEQWAKQNVNLRAILEYLMLVMPQK